MNKNTIKKAFTLVELIVVITILAVLATVAFVSFQGYGQSSRDSVRLADLKSMEKVINLYRLTNSRYPTPDEATGITYSGSTAWTQGVFGTNSYTSNTSLSNVPTDPITGLPYAYSVTNTKQEYQMAAVLEGEVSSFNSQSYAGDQIASVYVKGDYNGRIIKVRKNTTDYILGVPSIIASDITDVSVESILANQRLVYKGYNNLPASYSGSIYDNNGGFAFTPNQVILFEGDISDLENNPADRRTFLDNLQTNYSGTTIASESSIAEILSLDSNSSKGSNYVATVLNNNMNTDIDLLENDFIQSIESDWRDQDPNCDIPDIVIGNQTWAGCNSTLGTGLEYTDTNANGCFDYQGNQATGCDRPSSEKENVWNPTYGIDNIWGKLYFWGALDTNGDQIIDINDTNLVCGEGYHIPSQQELLELQTTLGSSTGNDLGWQNHLSRNNANNIVQALKIPLSGYKFEFPFNSYFTGRGDRTAIWSSTFEDYLVAGINAYYISFSYNSPDTYNNYGLRYTAASVRCIKD